MIERNGEEVLSQSYDEVEGAIRVITLGYTKLESDTLFVAKKEGWDLSDNNYSDQDKVKVDGVEVTQYNQLGGVTISNKATEESLIGTGNGSNYITADQFKVGRIIRLEFSNILSSGNNQSSTVRIKLGNISLVTNLATLPNGLSSSLFLGTVDMIVLANGINGIVRVVGKSDVVNNQLSTLVRNLSSIGDIAINLSVGLDVDFTYQFTQANTSNVCISKKVLILLK